MEETAVAEVATELAELPEMIGDVLADVADGAVRAHDDLLVFVGEFGFGLRGGRRTAHHPTSGVLAVILFIEDALFDHLLEGEIPEMQAQDFAFARQEVVLDVEPLHGFEMATENRRRDGFGEFGDLVVALFDRVQRFRTLLKISFVLLVPLRGAGVDVPAKIVEAL